MKNVALWVTDQPNTSSLTVILNRLKSCSSVNQLVILTFGPSPEALNLHINAKTLAKLRNIEVTYFLSEQDPLYSAQKELREFYPKFVANYPRFYGIEYLQHMEKSLWRGQLPHRLYALLRFDRALEKIDPVKTHIWFNIQDSLLESVLSKKISSNGSEKPKNKKLKNPFLKRALKQAAITSVSTVIKKIKFGQKNLPAPKPTAFFSFYPFYWIKPFEDTIPTERFFQKLPHDLGKAQNAETWVWLTEVSDLLKKSSLVNRLISERNWVVLEGFLSYFDWLKVTGLQLVVLLKILIQTKLHSLKNPWLYRGYSLEPLWQSEIRESLSSPEFFRSFFIEHSIRRAIRRRNTANLVYRLEFQPFEAALLTASKGQSIRTIAFQHAAISRNFLSYSFPKGYLGKEGGTPVPDLILATGSVSKQILEEGGYPSSQIKVIGALRFPEINEFRINPPDKQKLKIKHGLQSNLDQPVFFIAASLLLEETLSMLTLLLESLKSLNLHCMLLIKTHPSTPFGTQLIPLLKMYSDNIDYRILEGIVPFYELLFVSNAVLLTGSTVGIEALALGVTPIVVDNEAQFGNNPLTEVPDAAYFVSSTKQMINALKALLESGSQQAVLKQNIAVDQVFGNLESGPSKAFCQALSIEI